MAPHQHAASRPASPAEVPSALRATARSGAARTARLTLLLALAGATAVTVLPGAATADPRPSLAEVRQRVDALHHEAETATERYNAATETAEEAEERLDRLRDRAARSTAELNEARQQLGVHAAAAYRSGGLSPTLRLALSSDPDDFLDRAAQIHRTADRTGLAVRQLSVRQQRLDHLHEEAASQTEALRAAQRAAEEAGDAVRARLAEAEELLESLTAAERARVLAAREKSAAEAAEAAEVAEAARQAPQEAGTAQDGADPPDGDPAGRAADQRADRDGSERTSGSAAGTRSSQAIAFAQQQLGKPYGWGETGPDSYDCSGLTQAAWAAAGVSLPRTSYDQVNSGRAVSRAELEPGDLVFYYDGLTHVALYIGDGQIIHAARTGTPVRVDPVDSMPFAAATRPT